MTNTITVTGLASKIRHLVTAEGLHVLTFRITEAAGNDYVIDLMGKIAADNVATVTEGAPVTVAGVLTLRHYDAGTFQGVTAEISGEWIGAGADSDRFAEGARYALDSVSEFFEAIEDTDIYREFFDVEDN